ncbi:TSUP family transporter [Corynebacterium diphtheriae]
MWWGRLRYVATSCSRSDCGESKKLSIGFALVVLIIVIIGSLLQLLVRLLLLVALALVVFGATYLPPARGKIPAIVAGIAGGFMNTLAGVAGPAITVYAQASKWDQQRFAAALQPIFVISGLVSFIVKIVAGAGTITQISAWIWILGIAGIFLGISLGARASKMVSRTHARKLALLLVAGGGVSAVVRGLTGIQERVPHDRNSRGAP